MPGSAVRSVARLAGGSAAVGALARVLDRAIPSRPDVLAVLTYHRVSTPEEASWLHPGLISASPESFAAQMEFLASNHRVVSIDEVLDFRRGRSRLEPRSVLITFDDAYVDFATHAWPALRALDLPVTLFVPTAFPGDPERRFWWDRLHHAFATTRHREVLATPAGPLPMSTAAERQGSWAVVRRHLKTVPHDTLETEVDRLEALLDPPAAPPGSVLGWKALHRLAAEGVTLGAHSRTHPLLTRVPPRRLGDEIVGSIHDLRRETGRTPAAFAYPGGAYGCEVVTAVEEAGFALGFTTTPGINDLRHGSWMRLRRVNVGRSTTPSLLQLRLHPALARLDRTGSRREMPAPGHVPAPERVHGR